MRRPYDTNDGADRRQERQVHWVATFRSDALFSGVRLHRTLWNLSRILYSFPNIDVNHRLVKLNLPTPCPMRAPGEAAGIYALGSGGR